jgi:hypothetical protein
MIAKSYDTTAIGDVWLNSNGTISLVWKIKAAEFLSIIAFVSENAYFGNMLQIYSDYFHNNYFVAVSFHFYTDFKIPFKKIFIKESVLQNDFDTQITKAEERIEKFFRENIKNFNDWQKVIPEEELNFSFGKNGFFSVENNGKKKYGILVSANNFDNIQNLEYPEGITSVLSCRRFLKKEIDEKRDFINSIIEINNSVNLISTKAKTDKKTLRAQNQIDDLWHIDISYLLQGSTTENVKKLYREFEKQCFSKGIVLYSHGNSVAKQIKSLYPGMVDKNQHLIVATSEKCRKIIERI